MKKTNLPVNDQVTFNAEAHTYTLNDDTQLSGITSIIHKLLFPDMYAGVSSAVMEAARERGHRVHNELQLLFEKFPTEMLVCPETHAYIRLAKEHKLKQIAAEYLVSDNETVATCIDSVLKVKGGVALVDYKTTSVLYNEYLQWQLSIEAYLLEKQTGMKVVDLYAVHLPKPKDGRDCEAKLVHIDRLPDEYVFSLLDTFREGADTFDNPLHKLSNDTTELLDQYRNAEMALIELNASVEYYKNIQADIKAKLKDMMDAESASKWENDSVTITRSKDSVRRTFNVDKLYDEAPDDVNQWLVDNKDKFYKETKVNGNITIKFK